MKKVFPEVPAKVPRITCLFLKSPHRDEAVCLRVSFCAQLAAAWVMLVTHVHMTPLLLCGLVSHKQANP